MSAIRCQVTLNPSNPADDRYMNTWWISNDVAATAAAASAAFRDDIDAFYQAIDTHMSVLVNGAVPRLRCFDLQEPEPRQPVYENNLTALATTGTTTCPPELALVMSFKGTYVSGENAARKRGRIYLGPWNGAATSTADGRPTSTVISAIVTAAGALLTAATADTAYDWVVYSRATDESGLGGSGISVVTGGWVDNDWDIQRRRGYLSASRTTY